MITFDHVTEENINEHNQNLSQTPDHPYRILIIGCSGLGKTNALLNLIRHQPHIGKIYLCPKYPFQAKKTSIVN